jgi:hypothetical protein
MAVHRPVHPTLIIGTPDPGAPLEGPQGAREGAPNGLARAPAKTKKKKEREKEKKEKMYYRFWGPHSVGVPSPFPLIPSPGSLISL